MQLDVAIVFPPSITAIPAAVETGTLPAEHQSMADNEPCTAYRETLTCTG